MPTAQMPLVFEDALGAALAILNNMPEAAPHPRL